MTEGYTSAMRYGPCKLPSRADVAVMSTEEYDQHIAFLVHVEHNFTEKEKREVRLCRKIIRNREYARLSRLKAKVKTEELQQKVEYLELECSRLREEVTKLRCGAYVAIKQEPIQWREPLPLLDYDYEPGTFFW